VYSKEIPKRQSTCDADWAWDAVMGLVVVLGACFVSDVLLGSWLLILGSGSSVGLNGVS